MTVWCETCGVWRRITRRWFDRRKCPICKKHVEVIL